MIIRTKDFIEQFSEYTGYSNYEIKDLLRLLVNYTCEKLVNGDEIKIRGFIDIGTIVRDEYIGTIARTGQPVKYSKKIIPTVKFKQYIKDALSKKTDTKSFEPL